MPEIAAAAKRNIVDMLGAPQGRDEWIVFLVYWFSLTLSAAVGVSVWFDDGPGDPVFLLLVIGWSFGVTPAIAIPAVRLVTSLLPARCFRVPAGERALHQLLGVGIFGRLLESSGYNRQVADPLRNFDGTRAGLRSLEGSVRGGAIAHAAVFAIHVLLALAAFWSGYQWAAVWILLPGVIIHLYPVLLQRSIMLRLQPLLEKLT